MNAKDPPSGRQRAVPLVTVLLLYTGLLALFWSSRYGGRWIDGDAAYLTFAAEGVQQEASLLPRLRPYPSGFALQAILAFAGDLSGVTIQHLQLASSPWLAVLALAAFACYRELTGGAVVAVLASLFLLLQPDFLFYILRASHEKLTWTFALLLLYLLLRSYRVAGELPQFAAHVLVFYLVFWAMVSTNTFFACSFLAAIVFSLAASRLLRLSPWWRARSPLVGDRLAWRLVWVSAAGLVLVFAFITYVYGPAYAYYSELSTAIDRLSALFLGAQPASTYAYGYVETAWRDPAVYLALTGFQWLIVSLSLAGWVRDARRIGRISDARRLLWLMYGGFGASLLLGTVVDLTGYMAANLQMRLFTAFTIVCSPMAALFVTDALRSVQPHLRRLAAAFAAAVTGLAVVASLLKASNDPTVGNQWLFYSSGELQGMRWVDRYAQGRQVWVDTFSHQLDVISFWQGYGWQPANDYRVGPVVEGEPDVFYSRLTRLQADRSELVLPSTVGHLLVYDNGMAQFYHRRPRTPYQR